MTGFLMLLGNFCRIALNVIKNFNKIIFGKLRYQDGGHIQFRVYKCSLSGKGKKAITDWLDKYPEEYLG